MTFAPRGRAAAAVGLVLLVAFAVSAHLAIVGGSLDPSIGASLSLVPIAGLAFWAVRQSRRQQTALAAAGTAVVALWIGWPELERHFPGVFFIEHAGANVLLAIAFGRTLVGNREALCTRFARLVHGTLPAEVERYTRRVTLAWAVFFAAVFVLSCLLYLGGFLAAWSLLANILSPLLVAGMFVVEYLVRHRVLPQWERTGILGGIRAFTRHFGAAQPEAPR